ncbi:MULTISPECIES: hypothetical protein [unclassified Streptomyces]|uniref:hypothetical protein n=1 Tax=unclassified Streptomyces TaxID=2593676 RepID=UPI00136B8E6A|nr:MULTISPECIES: hypothetical protein [unclassified Streptomyces]NEA03702.1 hypothetical protein [Streptomyces sp. SID10116]MYY79692.1 hypothetical protein [Streptomyces sp. SID335]MYZ12834.1 hypothetical protein [Streptomyces sp. SID337]NDZ91138.1 hypothetical protein [Streptomyces sp. SID10115]NEB43535.1 hypothetical protein [Streptomyces sp. SID339]
MTVTEPSVIPPEEATLRRKLDRLQAELRQYKELAASQAERLHILQAANEGAYRDQYDAAAGPHLCPASPFGQAAPTPTFEDRDEAMAWLDAQIRIEVDPTRRAAWRLLRDATKGQA